MTWEDWDDKGDDRGEDSHRYTSAPTCGAWFDADCSSGCGSPLKYSLVDWRIFSAPDGDD